MVNKVILIGNLGKDPEVRTLENGTKVATFTLATNESYRKDDQFHTTTEWHNIVAWRFLAEKVERSLSKGMQVYVEGKLTHRKYQDKDNNDRYVTEVVAYTINQLGRTGTEGGHPTAIGVNKPPLSPKNPENPEKDSDDDPIPF